MQSGAVRQLIAKRYRETHGASAAPDFPHFCTIDRAADSAPSAVLGYRLASEARLFLEDYLHLPIEQELSFALGRNFARDRIVEIGALAAERGPTTIALWARSARHLEGKADVAVAVLTEPIRAMLRRLQVDLTELAPADPRRLPNRGAGWGRYYEMSPVICAGLIGPAVPKLAPWGNVFKGSCE